MIPCPNCKGLGNKSVWVEIGKSTRRIDCGWCRGERVIDPEAWIPYHPHRQRPKKYLDIKLKTGNIVVSQYPNGVHIGGFGDNDVEFVRLSKKDLLGHEQY